MGSKCREGQEGHPPAGAGAVDFDTHPLAEADQSKIAGIKGWPIKGQLGSVVKQDRASPRDWVERPYRCLHCHSRS